MAQGRTGFDFETLPDWHRLTIRKVLYAKGLLLIEEKKVGFNEAYFDVLIFEDTLVELISKAVKYNGRDNNDLDKGYTTFFSKLYSGFK